MLLTMSSSSKIHLSNPSSTIFLNCKAPPLTKNYMPTKKYSIFFNSIDFSQENTKWVLSNNNPTVVVTSSPSTGNDTDTGGSVVRKFYEGINGRDLESVEPLIAENCVYEDLIFPQPFVGRKAILDFFKKFTNSISTDLQFAIDDISEEDTLAVGVSWHLEWKGKTFPFSKGCSFYRLEVINGQRQIIYGRDSVEPAIKPGETALVAIRGVAWLLQQFPQLADRF
ncbi:hypothetical protein LIER_36692 [Lithospermum erythrorhizon]|uniref:SnoaL-like domain-containing protein n=1 Tax=Lithospermum erythrorhizon TaxID=34254 RepID=A0AAV3PA19_LITER